MCATFFEIKIITVSTGEQRNVKKNFQLLMSFNKTNSWNFRIVWLFLYFLFTFCFVLFSCLTFTLSFVLQFLFSAMIDLLSILFCRFPNSVYSPHNSLSCRVRVFPFLILINLNPRVQIVLFFDPKVLLSTLKGFQ